MYSISTYLLTLKDWDQNFNVTFGVILGTVQPLICTTFSQNIWETQLPTHTVENFSHDKSRQLKQQNTMF